MKKNELLCVESSKRFSADEAPYIFVTEFNDAAVKEFYKQFNDLSNRHDIQVIPILISSYGGAVHALLSMLDIMATASKPVCTISMGKAMSCGAVLLAAGTKGYRFAAPNTDIMIHEVSTFEMGKITDVENGVRQTKKLNKTLFSLLADFADATDNRKISKLLKSKGNVDWYLTPNDCKRLGLIDHIALPRLTKE